MTTETMTQTTTGGGNGNRLQDLADEELTKRLQALGATAGPAPWPYAVEEGRMVYKTIRNLKDGTTVVDAAKVADFEARTVEEVTTEEGAVIRRIAGRAIRGGPFQLELTAEDFADDRRLKAALDAAAGALDPVRAGMAKHLGPAIKLLTEPDSITHTRRYHRTGWAEGRFLLPGREPAGVNIQLPRKLPYSVNAGADLDIGLAALDRLLLAMGPERGAPVVAYIFGAPLAEPAGYRNERYGMFITGPTGSLKTSFGQAGMAIYGTGFMCDDQLIKWGEGSTRNAIMALATRAHDMPILIDNYKPTTGRGANDFVNLIHNLVEGGEKERLNRAAELKESRPIFCWPIITGEDVPDKDTAALARVLVVPFAWPQGQVNENLAQVQQGARHLPAVGAAWLDWLETDGGREVARQAGEMFDKLRRKWIPYLSGRQTGMQNTLRPAADLAINQVAWWALCQHPRIGPVVSKYDEQHQAGITEIANGMAEKTVQALEGVRFVGALRELVASGRVLLLPETKLLPDPGNKAAKEDPNQFIGWRSEDGSVYLIPEVTRAAVEKLTGADALGYLSNQALYTQLDRMGLLASKGKDRHTKKVRICGEIRRVLHLKKTAVEDEGEDVPQN